MSKFLTKEQVIELTRLQEREVEVPGFPAPVLMRSLTILEKDDAQRRAATAGSDGKPSGAVFMVWLIHYALAEPTMTIEEISRLSDEALAALFKGAMDASGLSKEVAARAEQSFRGGPGEGVPVSAGAGLEDDGRAPAR